MIEKMESRRNFIKAGLGVAGLGIIPGNGSVVAECEPETVWGAGPIPLNDILTSWDQVNKKFGQGLQKVTICDEAGWDEKKSINSSPRAAHGG